MRMIETGFVSSFNFFYLNPLGLGFLSTKALREILLKFRVQIDRKMTFIG